MQGLAFGDHITLVFSTVIDELTRGMVDDDEDAEAAPTNRAYWETRATEATVALADQLLEIAQQFEPKLELKYNKFYIGLSRNNQAFNFVTFRPRKIQINLKIKVPETPETDAKIENAGIEVLGYNKRWGQYQLRLTKSEISKNTEVLRDLIQMAYESRVG